MLIIQLFYKQKILLNTLCHNLQILLNHYKKQAQRRLFLNRICFVLKKEGGRPSFTLLRFISIVSVCVKIPDLKRENLRHKRH